MIWKGLHPIISLSQKVYQKGITLTKKEMKEVERHLERDSKLSE
jgi:hypothetical protein